MKDCVFCKIINGEAPATIDMETKNVIAFRNINPVAETHILVVPKNHIDSFIDIEDSTEIILDMAKVAQELILKNNIKAGYKLVFNGGKYQFVPHLHWHVLGGKLNGEGDVLSQT